MIYYGYPRCSTSRKGEKWLQERKVSYEFKDLSKETPSADELKKWHNASGKDIKKFFNTSGMKYRELDLKNRLVDMSDEEKYQQYKVREADRYKLLSALDFNQTWPADNLRKGNYIYGEGYPEGIEEALHAFLAKTSSKVVLLQPEDIFGVDKRQNFPGTDVDKYPNWRRNRPCTTSCRDIQASSLVQSVE